MPMEGPSGVEGTLKYERAPLSASRITKSVNVPPTSTPIRYIVSPGPFSCGLALRHQAPGRELADRTLGVAADDEVGDHCAGHGNELKSVAGETEYVDHARGGGRGSDDGELIGCGGFEARPRARDSNVA